MDYFFEETILPLIGVLIGIAVVIALVIGVISVPIYYSNRAVCEVHSKDFETSFGYWQGCMVKDPKSGIWISSDRIENINGTLDIN